MGSLSQDQALAQPHVGGGCHLLASGLGDTTVFWTPGLGGCEQSGGTRFFHCGGVRRSPVSLRSSRAQASQAVTPS